MPYALGSGTALIHTACHAMLNESPCLSCKIERSLHIRQALHLGPSSCLLPINSNVQGKLKGRTLCKGPTVGVPRASSDSQRSFQQAPGKKQVVMSVTSVLPPSVQADCERNIGEHLGIASQACKARSRAIVCPEIATACSKGCVQDLPQPRF